MGKHKFDIRHIDILNDPKRLEILDLNTVCSHFHLQKDMTLIDIGTGTGLFAEAFLKLLPEACCYALDIRHEAIDWIRNSRETYKTGRLIPLLMDEAKTSLEDNIADFLFMITLHHELEEPVELMKECRRILKPDGKLLIADWTKDATDGPPRQHRIEPSMAISHLETAGFKDIAMFDASKSLFCIGATNL
ncbi:MAG: class I SAM-dependent methyltransferase [Candidatus Poribacteria bacterium]